MWKTNCFSLTRAKRGRQSPRNQSSETRRLRLSNIRAVPIRAAPEITHSITFDVLALDRSPKTRTRTRLEPRTFAMRTQIPMLNLIVCVLLRTQRQRSLHNVCTRVLFHLLCCIRIQQSKWKRTRVQSCVRQKRRRRRRRSRRHRS